MKRPTSSTPITDRMRALEAAINAENIEQIELYFAGLSGWLASDMQSEQFWAEAEQNKKEVAT